MNNNQDNFNINPQTNNMNNQNSLFNNQNEFSQKNSQPLNVIPQNGQSQRLNQNPIPQNINNGFNQETNYANNINNINPAFNINQEQNNLNNVMTINNNNILLTNDSYYNEDNLKIEGQQNKFISSNIEMNNTALNDLNVDGSYNNMPKVDYTKDPTVQKNIEQAKKNTITITSEGKIFILIVVALLVFIFVMPYIFDFIRSINR